jgi:hypothetical protein
MQSPLPAAFALALTLTCALTAAAADPLDGLVFVDGESHRLSDWPGQTVFVVKFCGFCPTARKYMSTDIVRIGELIEKEHLAARLVCQTPDLQNDELKGYIAAACPSIAETALFAYDPINREKISLNNIWQYSLYVAGQEQRGGGGSLVDWVGGAMRASTGFRYPQPAGLSDKGVSAWWAVERETPGAFAACVKAAKRDSDAAAIVESVEGTLVERQNALIGGSDFATFESLEALLAEGGSLESLKPAKDRLKELAKDKAIKNELKARDIYRQCQELARSNDGKKREAASANLTKLAEMMPDTVYGKRAAGR